MKDAETALDAAIESVADGRAIDWPALDAAPLDDRARRRLRQLKMIAAIAEVHGSLPDNADDEVTDAVELLPPETARWGHLLLLDRIGEGAFGDVFHARDPWLDRDVALKLLKPAAATDPTTSRVLREARTLARIRHANVVTVYGADRHDRRGGMWMELVRGRTLAELLENHGPFSAREAAVVGVDLCRALAAIHAAGLVHRDIKAQNVMREDGGRIVLMDLGNGRGMADTDRARPGLTGTPLYLAPELFDGAPANERTDLYSLGVLLYQLVTGSYPVVAATVSDLHDAHCAGRVVRLRDARPDLPGAFVRVVDRALSRDPLERHASAGDLEADLMSALTDGAIAAAKPASEIGSRALGRRRTIVGAVIAAVLAAAVVIPSLLRRGAPGGAPGPIRSIAVLPLVNLSGDPAQEYFADGMTDELIATLGGLGSVKVTSRTSIQRYKGSAERLPDISRALNVDAIIEGTVALTRVTDGASESAPVDHVRINARLIRAGTDVQVWGHSFESDLSNVLKLQADVARYIAQSINIIVTPQIQQRLASAQTVDAEAYKLYLLGREHWISRYDAADLQQAVDLFRQAIRRDPLYARSYAGLADSYILLTGNYGQFSPPEGAALAVAASNKAIELDASQADAHVSLAFAKFLLQWDWAGSEAEFKRAIEINPSYASALDLYGDFLSAMGRDEEAISATKRAMEVDPLSLVVSRGAAWPLFFARRYEEAIAQLQQTLKQDSTYVSALSLLGRAHIENGQFQEGLLELQEAERSTGVYRYRAQLAQGYARAGQRVVATRLLEDVKNPPSGQFVPPYDIALVYAALGDNPQAIDWLERAYREHDATLVNVRHDPRFQAFSEEPRFAALLVRMRFPQP